MDPTPDQGSVEPFIDFSPGGDLPIDPLICTTALRVPPNCRVQEPCPERGRAPQPMTAAEAIELLQVGLDTHVAWALYLAEASEEERQRCYASIGALLWWDRMWIAGYQDVIELLRRGCRCTAAAGDPDRLLGTTTRLLGLDGRQQKSGLEAGATGLDERGQVLQRLIREPLEETRQLTGLRRRDSAVQ